MSQVTVSERQKLDNLLEMTEAQFHTIYPLLDLMTRLSSTMERIANQGASRSPGPTEESIIASIEKTLKRSPVNPVLDQSSIDALVNSISTSVTKSISDVFRDQFQNLLIPAFERSCQEMFRQIEQAFSSRLHDCKNSLIQCISFRGRNLHLSLSLITNLILFY